MHMEIYVFYMTCHLLTKQFYRGIVVGNILVGRSITYLMVGPHVLANSSQFSYTPHKINERGNVRKGY